MSKNPKTTKEEMIEGAFQLIRKNGHEAFSARNLATYIGCSTQPIMYQFPNLSELKDMAYQKADEFHSEYILAGKDLLGIGTRYVQFAAEEPFLFRFLFQSGRFAGLSIRDMIRNPDISGILRIAGEEGKQTPEEVEAYFEPLFAAVHGYASLIANNEMEFDLAAMHKSLAFLAGAIKGKDEE